MTNAGHVPSHHVISGVFNRVSGVMARAPEGVALVSDVDVVVLLSDEVSSLLRLVLVMELVVLSLAAKH